MAAINRTVTIELELNSLRRGSEDDNGGNWIVCSAQFNFSENPPSNSSTA
jgi:hypothetical protein